MQQNQQVLTQLLQNQQQQVQAAAQTAASAGPSPPTSPTGLAAKDLSKVLKHPVGFVGKTREEELVRWPSWSWEFEQYLSTLD